MGVIRAIDASNGEEFLRFDVNGEPLRIRLDWIAWQSFPLR
jgi:hypothetical protein